jgi:tetratricopeptide (TPR) repeat protein
MNISKPELSDVAALYYKGVALARLGKYEEAVVCYDNALEINPNFSKSLAYFFGLLST